MTTPGMACTISAMEQDKLTPGTPDELISLLGVNAGEYNGTLAKLATAVFSAVILAASFTLIQNRRGHAIASMIPVLIKRMRVRSR
jgi:hypothetical protein